jgi:putative ABC transport system ATP-binding protein
MIFLLFLIAFIGLWIALNFLLKKVGFHLDLQKYVSSKVNGNSRPKKEEQKMEIEPAVYTPESDNALEIHDLIKTYPSGDSQIKAVDIPSLNIKKKEFMAIMGRSGSGKSTLLNLLGALDKPSKGVVFLDGKNLAGLSRQDLNHLRNTKIGFVFQDFNLIPTLTALENVALPLRYSDLPKIKHEEVASKALEGVGLKNRASHFPSQLSGGERQRVAIARALVNKPTVVLADEPTGEVDTTTSDSLINLMKDLNQKLGTTFIIVTHDPQVAKSTNRVLRIQDGQIISDKRVIKVTAPEPELV